MEGGHSSRDTQISCVYSALAYTVREAVNSVIMPICTGRKNTVDEMFQLYTKFWISRIFGHELMLSCLGCNSKISRLI